MFFNKGALRAELARKGRTVIELAEFLGINEATMYRKLNGATEFTRTEIQKTCEFLGVESPMAIFFAEDIA